MLPRSAPSGRGEPQYLSDTWPSCRLLSRFPWASAAPREAPCLLFLWRWGQDLTLLYFGAE